MRRVLALSALLLLAASQVSATVRRDPVKVRMLGEPRAAAPGRPFQGTLELSARRPLQISNLRLEGAGWSVRSLHTPSARFLPAHERLQIPLEVQSSDPTRPLELVYDVDGKSYRKVLDLSEQALRRTRSGRTVQVAAADAVPRLGTSALLQAPAPSTDAPAPHGKVNRAERTLDAEEPQPGEVTNRTITVSGRFTYVRSDGFRIGADGVLVRIYDEDTIYDDLLDEGITDANGDFSISFTWDPCWLCEGQPDIYVYFETENSEVRVQDATYETEYSWETGTWDNYGGSSLDIGTHEPDDEDDYPAVHIQTDITRNWRWLLNNRGYDMPEVHVQWPDNGLGSNTAWYDSYWEEIHVGSGKQWKEDTHAHEYGHHWLENYGSNPAPDYDNGICDPGHCMWCQETDHDAFNEGWPNWLADVLTRSYATDYPRASQFTRSQEALQACLDANNNPCPCDPLRTEGFLGALLRDIEDSGQDDNDLAGGWQDRLNLGTSEIFAVADLDAPTTPMGFLNDFKARYPQYREGLWETAKDIGYEIDTQVPPAPTNLASANHTLGVESPVSRIRILWDRAQDDASGVDGYGIYLSLNSHAAPSNVRDIGDVTSWTSTPQAPGTYYFNIKTLDRAGKWSSTYAYIGPIVIRALEPANIVYDLRAGWSREVVPRGAADATSANVPEPATLTGNANSTWFNYSGEVTGEQPTSGGFTTRISVDGVGVEESSWGSLSPGAKPFDINEGPYTVRGGRHTLDVFWDITENIHESDENDNLWAHQWIWTPYALTAGTSVVRNSPPNPTEGWSYIVDGSTKWFNCDGLRFNTTGWWNAVWVMASSDADDYDCRLHTASTGAGNGFASNIGYSSRAAGCLDAVLVNKNVAAAGNYDVGVIENNTPYNPWPATYRTHHVISYAVSVGDVLPVALAQDEMLILREFNVGLSDVGPISMVVDIDPDDGPLTLLWLDGTFATGDLMDYDGWAVTDASGRARIDVNIAATGYHCVAVYRDPKDGQGPMNLTLTIERTPPDFEPYWAAGWYAPLVPRPANDGAAVSVPAPMFLIGNAASTYFNYATLNASPTPAATGMQTRVDLDGTPSWLIGWGAYAAGGARTYNSGTARNIRGGRHTIAVRHDGDELIHEIDEDDNLYGEQWVWSPLALALGSSVTRSAPPERTGGWDQITIPGAANWYNCDGLNTTFAPAGDDGYWGAVAVMPGASSDVDVRVHEAGSDAKNGFKSNLRVSAWGPGQSDYVLVNFNLTAHRAFDVGVLQGEGVESYTAEAVNAVWRGSIPLGYYGSFAMGANRILDLHEFDMPAGTWLVRLENAAGSVDWGVALHPSDQPYMAKSTAVAAGSAWQNAGGQGEEFTVTLAGPGLYCVAVWKASSADLGVQGDYRLLIGPQAVGVGDPPVGPGITQLAAPHPNPFTGSAAIAFELAGERNVSLEVFDVQGARVRTLAAGWQPAGRHRVVWDGRDDAGHRLSPGVYLVRLAAGD